MKMADNFSKQIFKFFTMLFIIWIPLTYGIPFPVSDDQMVHNNNYDMIMPDEHAPAESMHYQNFDEFFNAEAAENDAMAEMEMDESRVTMVQAPLDLNTRERNSRQHVEDLDAQHEKRIQKSLVKGALSPRSNTNDWEKFDYDMFLNHH